jgi:hypothetical protein
VTIRGFVNLLIGIAFAIGALYFLRESATLISPDRIQELTTPEVTYFVGTRVSLSLIITLIAYFFLSLYRKSLDDVKYYQNELTYIGGRLAALMVALVNQNNSGLSSVVALLMDADRNTSVSVAKETSSKIDYEKLVAVILNKLPQGQ